VEKREIGGKVQNFYVLRLASSDLRILVHVDKAEQVGIRPVAGAQEVDEVLQILREKAVSFERHPWNRRYRAYMDKIKSGSPIRSGRSLPRPAPAEEDQGALLWRAPYARHRARLVSQELSAARSVDRATVEKELESVLNEGQA